VLSVSQCRQFLSGDARTLCDAEVERLRDQLYALAHAIIPGWDEAAARSEGVLKALPDADRLDVEERAVILEFESHRERDEATRTAFASYVLRQGVNR
jgi:hypothetical protein